MAAAHSERLYGVVYLCEPRMVRLVIFTMNLMLRLQRKPVRAVIRPGDRLERIARENGLAPHISEDVGPAWHVAVFRHA
jgi:hypothetical protein